MGRHTVQRFSPRQIIYALERPVKHRLPVKRRLERNARVVDLLAALRLSQTAHTRAMLCEILGWRKAKSAVPDLIACLNDADENVRADAAASLGKIGAPSAGPALMRQLKKEEGGRNPEIIAALGAIGYREAEEYLTHMLQDADPINRGAAAWALGVLPATNSNPAIQSALAQETHSYAQARMQEALEKTAGNNK